MKRLVAVLITAAALATLSASPAQASIRAREHLAQRLVNQWVVPVGRFWHKPSAGYVAVFTDDLSIGAAMSAPHSGYIVFDRHYLASATTDDLRGAIIHELTHQYGISAHNEAHAEVCADYARYELNPRESGWTPSQAVLEMAQRHARRSLTAPW